MRQYCSSKFRSLCQSTHRTLQWLGSVDRVLHPNNDRATLGEDEAQATGTQLRLRQVALIVAVFGPLYGSAMGSYAFVAGQRSFLDQIPQMLYSGLKVPLLLAVTVTVSLPSFFVVNTLFGLREDFGRVLRAIVSAQSGLAIILASLLPLTLFSYHCVIPEQAGYSTAVLFNAMMFGLASVSSQVLLASYYRPLIRANPRHRWLMQVWIFVYAFVGIQAGYCLRPFIGNPNDDVSFLRDGPFENAYVRIWMMVSEVISHWL